MCLKMKIRNAKTGDIGFLLAGLKETRDVSGFEIIEKKIDKKEYLQHIKKGLIRVVEIDNEPVAFLYFKTDAKVMYLENKFFWIDIIYVKKEYRHKRLGSILHKDALKIARKKGYKRIYLDIFGINKNSIKFHDKIGFKPLYSIYKKDI